MTAPATVALGDVVHFTSGGTPSTANPEFYEDGTIPWITGADITDEGTVSPRSHISETAASRTSVGVLPAGSLGLVTRTSVGKVAIFKERTAFSQDITGITLPGDLDPRYVLHFLASQVQNLQRHARGATIKGVTRQVVSGLQIPSLPLDRQRRIASILDEADTIRAKRRAQLTLFDELPQAIFHETFGDPNTCRTKWPLGKISDLTASVQYGTSAKAGPKGSWPILRMGNLDDHGRVDLTDLKFLDLSSREREKYSVQEGDLLFNRTNSLEKVGKAAVVRISRPLAFAGYLIRVRLRPEHQPEYLAAFLNSPHGRAVRRNSAKAAVNQANISASQLREIVLPIPPASHQSAFAARIATIELERSRAIQALAASDELFTALQYRAFRGEL